MKRAYSLLAAGVVLAACGGGSSGGGGGGGGGNTTEIGYAIPATTCSGTSFAGVVILVATNRSISNACAQATDACVKYASLDGLALIVANYDTAGTATAVTPGTYPISLPSAASGTFAFAGEDKTDASCNKTSPSGTATGSVTITSVTASAVTGSYDVTQGSDHLTGSFNATLCSSGAFQGDICSGGIGSGTCSGTKQCL